ncbi:Serine/threonine-protein kinase/endoribonuclease IRE1a [Linum grandiflorum]
MKKHIVKGRNRHHSMDVTAAESLSRQFWEFSVLDYEEKVVNGFYDVFYSTSENPTKMPSLGDLETTSGSSGIEAVVLNRTIDHNLEELGQIAQCIALDCPATGITTLVHQLAELVTWHMGGPVKDANKMLTKWMEKSTELSTVLHSSVFPIGSIHIGLSRHRALLFKVLADTISLPRRLVKGRHYTGVEDGALNIIKLEDGREFLVDLMAAPGTLIPADILNTSEVVPAPDSFDSGVRRPNSLPGEAPSNAGVGSSGLSKDVTHSSRVDNPFSATESSLYEENHRAHAIGGGGGAWTNVNIDPYNQNGSEDTINLSARLSRKRYLIIRRLMMMLLSPLVRRVSSSAATQKDGPDADEVYRSLEMETIDVDFPEPDKPESSLTVFDGDTRLQRPSAAAISDSDGDDFAHLYFSLDDGEGMRGEVNDPVRIFTSLSNAAILTILGFVIFKFLAYLKRSMQTETHKRKKKKKKHGAGKNKIESSKTNEEGEDSEGVDRKLNKILTDLVDGREDERKIGRISVSNKEIAKGSNGTIVLEGTCDGRSVAVKRLVQTHHDVAVKEIKNLIASDQHRNIVRWYGVEHDQDFIYLALEQCSCNLSDFIYVHSGTFQREMHNPDGQSCSSLPGTTAQLCTILQQQKKTVELWKSNDQPSLLLLKLMRDVVSGLAHLHELGIIHRDLKPRNVLIASEKTTFCAKLSDMGISKRLLGDISSLTLHETGCGSSGWRAPEVILQGRQTRAVDMFSLGCVLFFCITGGKHPFGDWFEQDGNIINNKKDLFLIESIPEAVDLLTSLLDHDPDQRPKAAEVVEHPLFWTSEKRLAFLRDVSDRVELEDRGCQSDLLDALESIALDGNWDVKLEAVFLNNIGLHRRYKFNSVRDLLRVIRNKSHHYMELPAVVKGLLGSHPEGFEDYFRTRFPKLLIKVYEVIRSQCKDEEFFRKYNVSCDVHQEIRYGSRWKVGSGENIRIWGDRWVPSLDNHQVVSSNPRFRASLIKTQGLGIEIYLSRQEEQQDIMPVMLTDFDLSMKAYVFPQKNFWWPFCWKAKVIFLVELKAVRCVGVTCREGEQYNWLPCNLILQ